MALVHIDEFIEILLFQTYVSPTLAQRKHNEIPHVFLDLRKINSLIEDDYTNNNLSVSTLSDAAQYSAGKSFFCKLDCPQAYNRLQTVDPRSIEMLAFNLLAKLFPTKNSHKVSADLCLNSQVSFAITWTQLQDLTNVLNTWVMLGLKPTRLPIIPGTSGKSLSAFAKQD